MRREEQAYEHYLEWCNRLGIKSPAEAERYELVVRTIVTIPAFMPVSRGHVPAGD